MKIAIGNDHAAVELKKIIMEYVESTRHEKPSSLRCLNKAIARSSAGEP